MRKARLYGLFEQKDIPGSKKHTYERIAPTLAFPKEHAVRFFQNRLLDMTFAGKKACLRPVEK